MPVMTDEQMAADVQRAAGGDPEALPRLIVRCHTPLLAAVLSAADDALRSRIGPEDVLQQAYIAAFKTLAVPIHSPSPPRQPGPAPDPNPDRERGAQHPSRDRQGATNPNLEHERGPTPDPNPERERGAIRAAHGSKRSAHRPAARRPSCGGQTSGPSIGHQSASARRWAWQWTKLGATG